MYFKTISIFTFMIFLCSCSSSGEDSTNNSLELDGAWVSNCYLDDVNEYTVDEFIFLGNTFETSYKTWGNSSCSGVPIDAGAGLGTFTVGNSIMTSSGLDAVEVDFQINFNGQIFTVLDLIRKNGNEFYYGVYLGINTRPTELNFNILLTKQ